MKTFASEEEKNKAIEEFDERNGAIDDLEEIMEAEIKAPESSEEPKPDETPTETPPEETKDEPPVDQPEPEKEKPDGDKEPEGGEPQKSDREKELEATIAQQQEFIKTNLGNMDHLRSLEEKVATLEKTHSEKAPPEEKQEVELRASKLADLQKRRSDLLSKYPNPEDQLDAEYVKEMNEIQAGLFEEMSNLQHNMSVIQSQAVQATEKADKYIVTREAEATKSRQQEAQDKEKKQIEAFSKSNPQFTLSKSFDDVDEDYKEYQKSVSRVYLGREPKGMTEVNEAMNQLKRRSPGLLTRLKAAGISDEPTMEMKKYLGLCELWDYWTGYRKDPLTGDYRRDEKGNILPLVRYDSGTGKHVPDVYPSPEAAFNDKAAKEGFYTRQIVEAKIEGGKQALQAANKRDTTATELGATETQGGTVQAVEEALNRINQIDEVQAMQLAQQGDPTLLNEYNSLAKTLEWPTVEDPLAVGSHG